MAKYRETVLLLLENIEKKFLTEEYQIVKRLRPLKDAFGIMAR
ncbi:unnamed protein product [Nezara viridula]|uniref:Uncharacterized protein n=1 Tax=Nezara viridula TaxID=85310 RepID=A0A9P0ECD9_NEZVI|nr:unnamed protein product [Nezara viridula]